MSMQQDILTKFLFINNLTVTQNDVTLKSIVIFNIEKFFKLIYKSRITCNSKYAKFTVLFDCVLYFG